MATRTPTVVRTGTGSGGSDIVVTYAGMLNGDDGAWFNQPGYVLRSASVKGTLGAGGTVVVNGASDRTVVSGAQADESSLLGNITAQSTVVSGTYIGVPAYRPKVTAGDGTTSLTVTLYYMQD